MARFLLVHGLGLSSRIWSEVTPFLEEHGDVFAIDLPGHGGANPVEVEWETLWRAICDRCDVRDWSDTTFVLHSFSASILPELVESGLVPKKVVLVEGILCQEEGGWTERMLSYSPSEYDRWVGRFKFAADSVLKTQFISRPPAHMVDYWADAFRVVDSASLFRCGVILKERLKGNAVFDALQRANFPISYAFGSRTRLSKTKCFLDKVKRLNIYEVGASGHFPMIDSPKELSRIIMLEDSQQH